MFDFLDKSLNILNKTEVMVMTGNKILTQDDERKLAIFLFQYLSRRVSKKKE